jgi:hypothetical protein
LVRQEWMFGFEARSFPVNFGPWIGEINLDMLDSAAKHRDHAAFTVVF